jgi:hypothetical protein
LTVGRVLELLSSLRPSSRAREAFDDEVEADDEGDSDRTTLLEEGRRAPE